MTEDDGLLARRRFLLAAGGVGAAGAGVAWWWTRPPPIEDSPGWSQGGRMSEARGEMTAAVLDEHVYVPGGLSGGASGTTLFERYDPDDGEWTALAPLPRPRNHHATVAVDGEVLVLGGSDEFRHPPDDVTFAYDPTSDEWERRTPMPDGRWGHEAVVDEGIVYVVGGTSSDGATDVLRYDPAVDAWERGATTPRPIEHHVVEVLDGEIYAVGGRWDGENLTFAAAYDPEADDWREVAPVPTARSGAAGGVLEGNLHLAGGENRAPITGWTTDVHEVYDPGVGAWTDAPSLPLDLHGAASVAFDGRLYVVGGAWRQGPWSRSAWSDRTFVYDPGERTAEGLAEPDVRK